MPVESPLLGTNHSSESIQIRPVRGCFLPLSGDTGSDDIRMSPVKSANFCGIFNGIGFAPNQVIPMADLSSLAIQNAKQLVETARRLFAAHVRDRI